jgi:hypothetical protein
MAQYKDPSYLKQSQHEAFDFIHRPGQSPTNSGIYRCEGCGDEVACNKHQPLPPQNHHQHAQHQGDIRWRMIVFAVQK